MSSVVRRRMAISAIAVSTAVVAGLVVAPAVLAAAGGLTIDPNGAQNTEAAKVLTYKTQEADLRYGGTATFTRVGSTITFTAPITSPQPAGPSADREQSGTEDFTDEGNGLGQDGPADAGSYNASVTGAGDPITGSTTAGGGGNDTCFGCFTVLEGGPVAVTSATPGSIRPGFKDNVTIAGNNFERNSLVQFVLPDGSVDTSITLGLPTADPGCSGTVSNGDKITTRTTIKRCVTVASTAPPGARDIRVTNLDGNTATCAACFFVSGPPLTAVSPTADFNDPTQGLTAITFTGGNVTNGTPSLEYVGPPAGAAKSDLSIVGTNVRDYTGTSITADFDLQNAAPAAYQPFVRGSDGIVNACDTCRFTVVQRSERTPTITSMDSDTATAGIQKDIKQAETVTFVVTGTNFSKGALLTLTGTGLTVTSVEFLNPESLRATVTAASNASTGPRDAQITLTDGKKSNVCTGCVNVVANASPSPSRSATSTATMSPRPPACPTSGVTVRVNTRIINATGLASVTVTGAAAGATVELQGYSQNHQGDMTFDLDPTPVDRTGTADNNGSVTFNDLRPSSNTRLRARQLNCTYNGQSDVIEVRAQESLFVERIGTRQYRFSGNSIPAREGGLIISLYRITGSACAAGVEPSRCPGETFVGQNRASASTGRYSITITFPARDSNVRDEFVVKTGRDAQNAPGRSNARSLLIF